MSKGILKVGKWHFKLGIIPLFWRKNGIMLHFGIFKITKPPLKGEALKKDCYKGFWFRKEFEFKGIEISF